ncbi:MAG: CinA family protein [Burkholderiales bacterium]|nr:CinA family protein [Burkholderiales bacterium]
MTEIPGASRVFRGALVSYASEVKYDLLNIPVGVVVSEAAAAQMASAVRVLLKADIGIAATGVAGPDPQDDLPPGTVCLAVASKRATETQTLQLGNRGRETIRQFSATSLFDLLRRFLLSRR